MLPYFRAAVVAKFHVMMLDPKYEIKKLSLKDFEEVNKHFVKYFVDKSTYHQTFRIQQDEYKQVHAKWIRNILEQNASFACYHKDSGKMLGFRLASIHDSNDTLTQVTEDTRSYPNVRTMQVFKHWLQKDIRQSLKAHKIMMGEMALVDPEHLGKGLGRHLDKCCIEVAREKGCEYIIAMAATREGIRMHEKLGSKVLKEVKFADYVDPETGIKPDLDISPLNERVCITYQKVGNSGTSSGL